MRIWLTALVAWAGIIFLLSSLPNPPGPRGPEWQSYLAHTVEFGVFGFLAAGLVAAFRPSAPTWRVALAAWLLALLYGISDEFHQSFVANRHASALDVAFDALGGAIGVGLGIAVLRFRGPAGPRR
ncbi:MAG: VanZ family protein [Dehalococcoidia bacterium]|nr:VanZ family protein [Dehalococcoidia bacterium]